MATSQAAIHIDPSVKYQTWEGWGTSLCWWGHVVGSYPEAVREDIAQKAFKELRLNIVRYNIGGGENPEHKHMQPRAYVPPFIDKDGQYDWEADKGQRWMLQRAKELGANRFEAFSNSPPYFMTRNGCVSGAKSGGSNLDPAKREEFAKYLVDVVKRFKDKWGIRFETLEPLNEPSADWWKENGRQEGCHVSAGEEQSALVEAVAAELEKQKLKTKVSASDESIIEQATRAIDEMSASAMAKVARLNTHTYGGSKRAELQAAVDRVKKPFWMSEYGDHDASGMTLSLQILKDLKQMRPSAWCYWQVVDQTGSGWGFLDMDLNRGSQTYVVNRKFYVMANYSRFIRPGARLIDVDDAHSLAVLDKDRLIIVTTNPDEAKTVSFDLFKFKAVGKEAEAFVTGPEMNLKQLPRWPVTNGTVSLDLGPRTVTTIVIRGCRG